MGTTLSNVIKSGYNFSYHTFEPINHSSNDPVFSQSFTNDGTTFKILYFYSKKTIIIYLVKIHGLSMQSFKKNEKIQFRFIFDFCFNHTHTSNKNNLFDFQTSTVFSFSYPFIVIPNISVPFKIGIKYIDEDSDFSIYSCLKNIFKTSFDVIPNTIDFVSSFITSASKRILKYVSHESKSENEDDDINQEDESNSEITEQQLKQIRNKKIIDQQELLLLQSHFSLNDKNHQIPYVGIDNLGVTCYISAALHFLGSVTPFVQLILNERAKQNTTAYELQKIFIQLKMASIVATKKRQKKPKDDIKSTKNENQNKTQTTNKKVKNQSQKTNENKTQTIKEIPKTNKTQTQTAKENQTTNKEENQTKNEKENENQEEEDFYDEIITPVDSCFGNISSISIKKFVLSFGNRLDELVFNEQDTHEFITILFDKIDSELGDEFAKKRKLIFGVTSVDFIRCKNVDYGCQIEEELNDINLPLIGNCSSVKKSLNKITSKEQMKGDNMWDTGDSKFGKQEVYRYLRFKKLPPFLTFHLMRYAQNEYTLSCEEVNSYFDCPEVIDMKKYIISKNDTSKTELIENSNETKYKLMAIIAHRGSLHSGHYVSYISPYVNDNWFLFNDSFVSASSFKDVQETYGKSSTNTFLGISNFFHQSNDFYSYLVGYVRFDYIKNIRYGICAPTEIVPNVLTMRFSALFLDASSFSFNCNDDKPNLSLIQKPIYGIGKRIEWGDINETIEDLIISTFSEKDNTNQFRQEFFRKNYVFINYPRTKILLGPLQTKLKASEFTINGQLTQFIVINSVKEPVFICKGESVYSIETRKTVFQKYNKNYLIKFEKRIITDKNFEFPIGAIVTLLSRDEFNLVIRDTQYKAYPQTTYQEIQQMIAKNIIKINRDFMKNDKDNENKNINNSDNEGYDINTTFFDYLDDDDDLDSLARRVILYQGISPLKPRLFKNTQSLLQNGKLDFRILLKPSTANSIDMYEHIYFRFVDFNYNKREINCIWLPRTETMKRIFHCASKICNAYIKFEKHVLKEKIENSIKYSFVLSLTNKDKIQTILDREDDFSSSNVVRVDILRTEFPNVIEDFETIMENYGIAPIEVRTILHEPLSNKYNSIGFFYFNKTDTYCDLMKKVNKVKDSIDDVITENIKVETQNTYFRGYTPKKETVIFDSLQIIKTNPNFQQQRPILTIQAHKKQLNKSPK